MTTAEIKLIINGEPRDFAQVKTLATLIETLGLRPERVAVELNQTVIRRAAWADTVLNDSDKIEIVHFVGGG